MCQSVLIDVQIRLDPNITPKPASKMNAIRIILMPASNRFNELDDLPLYDLMTGLSMLILFLSFDLLVLLF